MILLQVLAVLLVVSRLPYSNGDPCGTFQDSATQLAFYCDGIDLRTTSENPTYSGYFDFQGLRLQLNISNGQLQVVEIVTENVVWGWGNSGENCESCHLVFQCDGNFVLYYADGSSIATATYNENAQYVMFYTSPPYITVVDGNCTQLWPNSKSEPTLGPLARTTTVAGPTFNATETNFQALAASSWRSHFGVNTHCSQGWSSAMVYNLTTYVGASVIRDEIPSSDQISDYARMFKEGISLNVVAGGVSNKSDLDNEVLSWANFQKNVVPGMLLQIEGFNEINNFGFTYNGVNPKTSYSGMAQAMRDLYGLVRSNPDLEGVPVLDLTGGNFEDGACQGLSQYLGHADFGTIHNYAWAGRPSISIDNTKNLFLLGLGQTYPWWQNPTSNFAMTETGYHSDSFPDGVTELAQGIMVVNTLLNGLSVGFRQTFIYELWDEEWSGYDGPESHFGLFRHNETTKPAARALHFLSGLLSDSNTPSSLNQYSFTLTNLPIGAEYLIFQNSGGLLFLVVWTNAPVYDPISQTDITPTPVQVTLSLSASTTFNVYDIYSTTADDTQPLPPIQTQTGTSVQFSMGSQAVVISFTQASKSVKPIEKILVV